MRPLPQQYGDLDPSDWFSQQIFAQRLNQALHRHYECIFNLLQRFLHFHKFQKALDKNQDMFPNLTKQNHLFGIKNRGPDKS